jgi:hypothetical protein
MNSPFSWGQRYEFGRVENNNGWICSILRLDRAINGFEAYNSGVVLYDPVDPSTGYSRLYGFIGDGIITIPTTSPRDPNAIDFSETVLGNLPLVFDSMTVRTISDIWGVELSYLRRTMTFHNGGNLEFTFGARYLEFNEDFDVSTSGGVLNDNTYWNTHGQNHIIGPQFGARYNKQVGRWGVSADGRFTAGYNRQNISQDGNFGYTGATTSNMHPIAWPGQSFSSHVCFDEFSPLMELRLDLHYVLTRAINLRVGWTGFWAGGVVRPANVVEDQLPAMGIDASDNKENLFVNGVNFGIEFNR